MQLTEDVSRGVIRAHVSLVGMEVRGRYLLFAFQHGCKGARGESDGFVQT